MYYIYRALTYASAPILSSILKKRLENRKEDQQRFVEKKAVINMPRPNGMLIWVHAASVGEAHTALIVVNRIIKNTQNINILLTTGTVTSAKLVESKLPDRAYHQFAPLDHPVWVKNFLSHWQPNIAIWMESELWPNMLYELKQRKIKAFLLNAHMSDKSFNSWKKIPFLPKRMLGAFEEILCQTILDKERYSKLGGNQVHVTDNLKYSAEPLGFVQGDLDKVQKVVKDRPIWLYASTHKGEEKLAAETHLKLQKTYPELLTIIVPRHPERREEIAQLFANHKVTFRGENKDLPKHDDQIYVADTLGELGLFYTLSPIAMIGRSFSDDGGGGHNPIEAANLNCAVLSGPNVQNLQEIFDDMCVQNACISISGPENLAHELEKLLKGDDYLQSYQKAAKEFSKNKTSVIDKVMAHIQPSLDDLQ